MIQDAPASWIISDALIELYGFPSLARWGIHTIADLKKYHQHELKTLTGMPKQTYQQIIVGLKRLYG
jgi:hypothetical protein